MSFRRLDRALVAEGLARSRGQAVELIHGGQVLLEGQTVLRPATPVAEGTRLELKPEAELFVGRAAHKLEGALKQWGLPVTGRSCLDVGAGVGGFTQVLLRRGARWVLAVDVGRNQLHPSLAADHRVRSLEGTHVCDLTVSEVQGQGQPDPAPIDLTVVDLSFISLTRVLPKLLAVTFPCPDYVLLVKPQFEVGREQLPRSSGGVVRDSELRKAALERVRETVRSLTAGTAAPLAEAGIAEATISGRKGNLEYLLWLSRIT